LNFNDLQRATSQHPLPTFLALFHVMETEETYGRNRQSIANLEEELVELFRAHPKVILNNEDLPVIPGDALVDILRSFSQNHNSYELMTKDEEEQLVKLLEANPGIEVTPSILIQFIAQRTDTSNQDTSPERSPSLRAYDAIIGRGRPGEKTEFVAYARSRSSSQDATGMAVYANRSGSQPSSRPPSRPPSRGALSVPPKTPVTRESPFDSAARQRTTPLAIAPSSWARRAPPSRRKSDAGLYSRETSDSEVRAIHRTC
jgi:hypothetical protein